MTKTTFPFAVVVFDLDGTLIDTAPDLTIALNYSLSRLDRPAVPSEVVRPMFGHGIRELVRQGLEVTGPCDEALIDHALPLLIEFYNAHVADHSAAFPGVDAALAELEAFGVTLAICTNKPEAIAVRLVDAVGWEGRFAAIVGGDTMLVRKPRPEPLLEAIVRAGGGPAVFVGDSYTDTETAREAGLPCIAVTFGYRDRKATELHAAGLIDHFSQLVPTLRQLQS